MVYDNVQADKEGRKLKFEGQTGYAIHQAETNYEIYTDDGHGNGDYVCETPDYTWAKSIAYSLNYMGQHPVLLIKMMDEKESA